MRAVATRSRLLSAAALCAAALALLAVLVGSRAESYTVTAVFDNVKGLVSGNDVLAGGVRVGRVGSIELGEDGYPRVALEIDRDFRLRRGATADLQLFSLSGQLNRYVALTEGSGPRLRDGSTIGLAHTDQPVELDDLLRTLDGPTRADVRSVFGRLNDATAGRGPDLARALASSERALPETAALLEQVNADGAALRTLVRDGHTAMRAIAREPGSAGGFVDNLAGMLRTTAGREAAISASLQRLPGGLRATRSALERVDRAVPALRALVPVARPAVRELAHTARELRPALAALRPTLASARRLTSAAPRDLRALRPLLRTAGPFLRRADPVLCMANPILDEMRAYGPELNAAIVNFADTFATYDANGHMGRLGVVAADTPKNEIGPEDSVSGSVRRPFFRDPGSAYPVNQPWRNFEQSFLTSASERCPK